MSYLIVALVGCVLALLGGCDELVGPPPQATPGSVFCGLLALGLWFDISFCTRQGARR